MIPVQKRIVTAVARAATHLRPYQAEAKQDIYSAWAAGCVNVLAVLPTGAGKCLGRGTPVLMFDGAVKNVEDVKPGDLLRGPDTSPRKVSTTCTGREMLYRVTPNKGDPYIVNESHILSLKKTGLKADPRYPSESGRGDVVNIPVREYLTKSKTFKHTHKGYRSGASFGAKDLDERLPPYLLGLWLGDGSSRSMSITTEDREVIEYLNHHASALGARVRKEELNNASDTYHIVSDWDRSKSPRTVLRTLGLLNNKHIPQVYKTASDQQRLELLAGIIDSDGCVSKSGYSVTFKNERLARDTVFVARSLGFSAYPNKVRKVCTNTGAAGEYWRFELNGGKYPIPVRLSRKVPKPRRQKKNPLVTGIRVEPIGEGDYFGFEIDRDRLFMLGDFTVTHNTVLFSDIVHDHVGASCAIAHRQELVSQISLALARDKVRHRIVGPQSVVKLCVNLHMLEVGASYYDPQATCAVAGVDTLVKRADELGAWLNSVTLCVQDEAHHVLEANKWGTAFKMFPNAKGLGVTATPRRADGKGLGRHADGLFDTMIEGPGMRDLINMGYLTEYRVFAPPSDLDLSTVNTSQATGDYNPVKLKAAVRKSHVIGDVVSHYLRIAPGKLGVTFATDVETATDIAAQFNAAGIPAAVVSAKTPAADRAAILRRFKNRELLQLVNVDLFGEGFDLPAIEVVSMARPTQSYALFVQQFGRVLRLLLDKSLAPFWSQYSDEERRAHIAASTKPHGIVIDHVGNVERHGLPDAPQTWTLDRREKRSKSAVSDAIPVRACPECTAVYERIYNACPYCGHVIVPASRGGPEQVDGDLVELDAAALAALRGDVARVDMPLEDIRQELAAKHMPIIGQMAGVKRHAADQEAQKALRESISWWAGYQRAQNRSDSESYRRFYFRFGTDVLTAQTLKAADATALADKVNTTLGELKT